MPDAVHSTQRRRRPGASLPEERVAIPLPRFDSIVDVPSAPRPKLESAVQAIPDLPRIEKKPQLDDIGKIYDSDPDKPFSAIPDRFDGAISPVDQAVSTTGQAKVDVQEKGKLSGWWDSLDPANKKAINRALLTTGLSLLAQSGEVSRYPISTAGQFGKAALRGVSAYDQSLKASAGQAAASAKQKMEQDKFALEEEKLQLKRQRLQMDVEKLLSDQRLVEADKAPPVPEREEGRFLPEPREPAQPPTAPIEGRYTLPGGIDFMGKDQGIEPPVTAKSERADKVFPSGLDIKGGERVAAVPEGKIHQAARKTNAEIKRIEAQTKKLENELLKGTGKKVSPFGKVTAGKYKPASVKAFQKTITKENPFGDQSVLVEKVKPPKERSQIDQARAAIRGGTADKEDRQIAGLGRLKYIKDQLSIYQGTLFSSEDIEIVRRQAGIKYDVEELEVNPVPEKLFIFGDEMKTRPVVKWFVDQGFGQEKAEDLARAVIKRLSESDKSK